MGDAIKSGVATSKPKEAPKAASKPKTAPKRNTRNIPAAEKNKAPVPKTAAEKEEDAQLNCSKARHEDQKACRKTTNVQSQRINSST